MLDGEGFGFKFWAGMIGTIIAVAFGGLILFLIFARAVYAWGFFGAFLALAGLIVLVTWLIDRRHRGGDSDY